jgi:4-hydroxy-L-threonine phosphate dehydrogenase PdxA
VHTGVADAAAVPVAGLPMPITTPAHGTGYDFAGRGTATPGAIRNALLTAARMGSAARAQRRAAQEVGARLRLLR